MVTVGSDDGRPLPPARCAVQIKPLQVAAAHSTRNGSRSLTPVQMPCDEGDLACKLEPCVGGARELALGNRRTGAREALKIRRARAVVQRLGAGRSAGTVPAVRDMPSILARASAAAVADSGGAPPLGGGGGGGRVVGVAWLAKAGPGRERSLRHLGSLLKRPEQPCRAV